MNGAARPDVRVTMRARSPVRAAEAKRLALAVLAAEARPLAALSLTFVGPARIRTLNRTWLGHDAPTDVIAFGLGPAGREAGDVYICPAVAARNARAAGASAGDEVRRLVVHGVLHVLGHDHPEGPGRTASAMWRRQERYLSRFAGRR